MTLSPQLSSSLSLEEFLKLPETKPHREYDVKALKLTNSVEG